VQPEAVSAPRGRCVNVGNAQTLYSTNPTRRFDNLAREQRSERRRDRLPVFLGRNVFTAIEAGERRAAPDPNVAF